jgi:hypothetical protein
MTRMHVFPRAASAALFLFGAAAGLAALAAAPSECRALSPASKPRLERSLPPRAFAGGQILLVGTDFGEKQSEITATVNGEPAQVVQLVSPTEVYVALPAEIKKGKAKVELTVAGQTTNTLEVEIRDEKEREQQAEEDAATEAGTSVETARSIQLNPPEAVAEMGRALIRVTGAAPGLPNGCNVDLTLSLGSQVVGATTATVESGAFGAAFGPFQKALWAADYWVDAKFDLDKQSKKIRMLFNKTFTDPLQRQAHAHGADRQPVRVGTADQQEAQAKELKSHAASMVSRIRDFATEIGNAYCSAGRSAFRGKDGKVDEVAWEEWCNERALRGVGGAEREKRVKAILARREFLTNSGAFADGRWRDYIDAKREEIATRQADHEKFRETFLTLRDPEAMQELADAWAYLVRLTHFWSRDLYERNQIPIDPKDQVVRALSSSQLTLNLERIEKRVAGEKTEGAEGK